MTWINNQYIPQIAQQQQGNVLGGTASGAATGLATGGPLGAIIGGGLGLVGGVLGEIGAANQRRRRKKLANEYRGLLGKDVYDQGQALSFAAQAQDRQTPGLVRRATNQYGVGQGRALRAITDSQIEQRSALAGNVWMQNQQAKADNDRYYRGLIAELVG